MGRRFDTIRNLVLQNRYRVSQHAAERLEERGVLDWQVVHGIEHGDWITENPQAQPNPSVEVRQSLADGTPIKAVWSHVIAIDVAKLVTVHFFDE